MPNPQVGALLRTLNTPAATSTPATKTAAATADTLPSVENASAAVERILQETKTASAAPQNMTLLPDHLNKVASDLENAESAAMLKEAQLMGAAMADSFMTRMIQYGDIGEKIAAMTAPAHGKPGKPGKAGKSKKNKLPPALKAELNKQASVEDVKTAAAHGAADMRSLLTLANANAEYAYKSAQAQEALQNTFNAGVNSAVAVLYS